MKSAGNSVWYRTANFWDDSNDRISIFYGVLSMKLGALLRVGLFVLYTRDTNVDEERIQWCGPTTMLRVHAESQLARTCRCTRKAVTTGA